MWTTNSTLSLIEDLQMRRCLWDVSSDDYKDRGKKANAVAELAQKYEVSTTELEKKLHTLKGKSPTFLTMLINVNQSIKR